MPFLCVTETYPYLSDKWTLGWYSITFLPCIFFQLRCDWHQAPLNYQSLSQRSRHIQTKRFALWGQKTQPKIWFLIAAEHHSSLQRWLVALGNADATLNTLARPLFIQYIYFLRFGRSWHGMAGKIYCTDSRSTQFLDLIPRRYFSHLWSTIKVSTCHTSREARKFQIEVSNARIFVLWSLRPEHSFFLFYSPPEYGDSDHYSIRTHI